MSGSKFRPIGRKSAEQCCQPLRTPLNSFQKKISSLSRTHSGGILKFVFWVLGLKNAYFGKVLRLLLLLRFWVPRCCFLKSSKSGLSEKYMVYGLFLAVKKLYHFEIPLGYCYSPLDGGIIFHLTANFLALCTRPLVRPCCIF